MPVPRAGNSPIGRIESHVAVGLTTLALIVRLVFADGLYLNPDESLQLNAACSGQWNAYHHPPFVLWWLWLVSWVSEKECWLRLLFVIAGAVTPVATALWLRAFVSPWVAWTVAVVLGFSPPIVLLTVQLRGYSLALSCLLLALLFLERFWTRPSTKHLFFHFSCLYLGVLNEFSFGFALAGIGAYSLARLRHTRNRRFVPHFLSFYAFVAVTYLWLWFYVIRPLSMLPREALRYVEPYMWSAGTPPVGFIAKALMAQCLYITGGIPQGWIALFAAVAGIGIMIRQKDPLVLLLLALLIPLGLAFLRSYPMGPTRHTVVVAALLVLPVALAIDRLGKRSRIAALAFGGITVLLWARAPWANIENLPLRHWNRAEWEEAMQRLILQLPAGSIVVTDGFLFQSIQAYLSPRAERTQLDFRSMPPDLPQTAQIRGISFIPVQFGIAGMLTPPALAAVRTRVRTIRKTAPQSSREVWILEGGWERGPLQKILPRTALVPVMEGPLFTLLRQGEPRWLE